MWPALAWYKAGERQYKKCINNNNRSISMVKFQQNTSKPNSAVHRGIRPWSSGIHPRDARMVWHREINKYDTLY